MDEDKLEQIIRRLESVEQRIGALEGMARPRPEPPPFLYPSAQHPMDQPADAPSLRPQRLEPSRHEDAEVAIGTKVLPWVGAGIVVLGLVYGAKWAVDQGWVTPVMQFSGLSLLGALFVSIGLWRDRLGEWFGQLLAGIGVAGLMMTSVAGTTTFNLYGGNVAVGLAVFFSLASLAFGALRGSRGFGALGLVGGVLSSWLPATDKEWAACLFLHALVVGCTAAVAGYRKWPELAMGAWVVGTVAILPFLFVAESELAWQARVGVLYAETLALSAAYAHGVNVRFDPYVVWPSVTALISACLAMVVRHGTEGLGHVLALAAAMSALALIPSDAKQARLGLGFAGLLVALVVAPFGLDPGARLLAFTLLAIASGVFAIMQRNRGAAALAWIELCVAGGVYIWMDSRSLLYEVNPSLGFATPEWVQLVLMLGACGLAAVGSAFLVTGEGEPAEAQIRIANVVACILAWLLFARLGRLFLTSEAVGMSSNAALTVAWATYAIALIPLGFWVARKSIRYTGFGILALTIGKILVLDLSAVDLAVRILILIVLGSTMLAVSYFAYVRPRAAGH